METCPSVRVKDSSLFSVSLFFCGDFSIHAPRIDFIFLFSMTADLKGRKASGRSSVCMKQHFIRYIFIFILYLFHADVSLSLISPIAVKWPLKIWSVPEFSACVFGFANFGGWSSIYPCPSVYLST